MAEVSRQVLKQLGFNGSVSTSEVRPAAAFPLPTHEPWQCGLRRRSGRCRGLHRHNSIASYVNAWSRRCDAHAGGTQPDGDFRQQAKFYVGGEYGWPASRT